MFLRALTGWGSALEGLGGLQRGGGMTVNLREVPGNSLQKRSKGFRKIAHTTTLPVPQAAQVTFLQPKNTKVFNR